MPGRFKKCLRASQQRHECVHHDVVMTLGRFYYCYLRNARELTPNFHPIVFKFCAYVNYMLIYNIHRERKFPMTITNLAALFLELFEYLLYLCAIFTVTVTFFSRAIYFRHFREAAEITKFNCRESVDLN